MAKQSYEELVKRMRKKITSAQDGISPDKSG